LNFFERGGCAYLIDSRPRIRRYSEKAEPENHLLEGTREDAAVQFRRTEVLGWNRFPISDETRIPEVGRGL